MSDQEKARIEIFWNAVGGVAVIALVVIVPAFVFFATYRKSDDLRKREVECFEKTLNRGCFNEGLPKVSGSGSGE